MKKEPIDIEKEARHLDGKIVEMGAQEEIVQEIIAFGHRCYLRGQEDMREKCAWVANRQIDQWKDQPNPYAECSMKTAFGIRDTIRSLKPTEGDK